MVIQTIARHPNSKASFLTKGPEENYALEGQLRKHNDSIRRFVNVDDIEEGETPYLDGLRMKMIIQV